MSAVFRFSVPADALEIPEREILRYLGYTRGAIKDSDIVLARGYAEKIRPVIKPAACWGRYPIELKGDGLIELPWDEITSRDICRNLDGCGEIFVFAATLGIDFDRLLHSAGYRSMADAAGIQAAGAAAAESFVDMLNDDLKARAEAEGLRCRPRYSPGFGDFTLEQQKGFFRLLDPSKHIGLSLKENCIMVPEKSVTALIGIYGQA
jgi:hypothetical protein